MLNSSPLLAGEVAINTPEILPEFVEGHTYVENARQCPIIDGKKNNGNTFSQLKSFKFRRPNPWR